MGESKETTRATLKEFGAKTNGTTENNECKLEDAKMAAGGVVSPRDRFPPGNSTSQKRVKERGRFIRTMLTETKTVVTPAHSHL